MENLKVLWDKADSLRGCLSNLDLKTESSYRRHQSQQSGPFFNDGDALHLDEFVSDEAKILQSKAFRVLRDKTQVFTYPATPLIRTRQSHVLEVVAHTVVACQMLGLNTNLARAAALGHDIGHVPFGHPGEAWLAKQMGEPFCHEVMGVIIAQKIERAGKGLNLTWHTLDAMMRHSGNMASETMSPEAWVLRYTDKFAYVFADVNDVIGRMGYPASQELRDLVSEFGSNQRERGTTAIAQLVIESAELKRVSFRESELAQKFQRLRDLMNEIYPRVTLQNIDAPMSVTLECLQRLGLGVNPFMLLALMTDRDVEIIAKSTTRDLPAFRKTSLSEVLQYLSEIGNVDLVRPGLNW